MSTYALSGTGTQSLSANVTALHITITTLPAIAGQGRANPANNFDVGLLRFGDGTGYFSPIPVTGGPQWCAVPAGTTVLGYAMLHGAEISVVEVIGGTPPFGGGNTTPAALDEVILSGTTASITFSSIAGGVRVLRVVFLLRTDQLSQTIIDMFVNGDATTGHYGGSGGNGRITVSYSANYTAGLFTPGEILLPYYADASSVTKAAQCGLVRPDNLFESNSWLWTPTSPAAITSLQLKPRSGNFVSGSRAALYGMG